MCRSLDGSTLGYESSDEGIVPIKGNNSTNQSERDEILNIDNTVIDIAKICQQYKFANSDSVYLLNTIKQILQNLSLNPSYKQVCTFAKNVKYEHY